MVMKAYSRTTPGSNTLTWISGPTPLPPPSTNSGQIFITDKIENVFSQKGNRPYVNPNPHGYAVYFVAEWRGERTTFYPVPGLPEHRYVLKGCFSSDSAHGYLPTWERSSLYNSALEKLNSKVRGGLDLSISLAEAGQTQRMIRSVTKFTDFARYAGLGGFSAGTRALANGWLQFQYGWKPLLSDVFAAADEGLRIVINKLEHFHARKKLPLSGTSTVFQAVAGNSVPTEVELSGVQSCQFNISLKIPENSFDPARWTSMNPVSIGWELIPYSFVVDWFVDVGSYLRGVETALLYNTNFVSGSVSELFSIRTEEHVEGHIFRSPDGLNVKLDKCSCFSRKVNFSRSVLTSYPMPQKPTFKVDMGAERCFSAASLLRQLLKK
jgi:hypothetical protein